MKTTLELSDELVRRIKIRAVDRNQKLKDTVTQLLELGLACVAEDKVPAQLPTPVRLKDRELLTIEDIESAIAAGRE